MGHQPRVLHHLRDLNTYAVDLQGRGWFARARHHKIPPPIHRLQREPHGEAREVSDLEEAVGDDVEPDVAGVVPGIGEDGAVLHGEERRVLEGQEVLEPLPDGQSQDAKPAAAEAHHCVAEHQAHDEARIRSCRGRGWQ